MPRLMENGEMQLSDILPQQAIPAELDVIVSGMSCDSRLLRGGELFFAYPGSADDGRRYIDQAIDNGAAAIAVESSEQWQLPQRYQQVPVIPIQDLMGQLSQFAAAFYAHPSRDLSVIGVTGTNGKTSSTHYMAQILNELGYKAAVIGTMGNGVDVLSETKHTTPDAIRLQQLLREFAGSDVSCVAMEVSSHGLHQGRVAAVEFDVAVLTNLSHDHLDYHGSMEEYGEAKKRLFSLPGLKHAVVNADDDYGLRLSQQISPTIETLVYSLQSSKADLYVRSAEFSADGCRAEMTTPWGDASLETALLGEFNLSNLLGVIGSLCCLGFALPDVVTACRKLVAVPGRLQSVPNALGPNIVIDYAHTPDALLTVLQALREHGPAKLWCVFGCGGNRDTKKRALMGSIASEYADRVVITNDNPRTEDPQCIAEQIHEGCENNGSVHIELDRAKAIDYALANCEQGDCVLIAGKGHEEYQEVNGTRLPFNDYSTVQRLLTGRGLY